MATLAVAVMAAEGMRIERYTIGRDGELVPRSNETWVVTKERAGSALYIEPVVQDAPPG